MDRLADKNMCFRAIFLLGFCKWF